MSFRTLRSKVRIPVFGKQLSAEELAMHSQHVISNLAKQGEKSPCLANSSRGACNALPACHFEPCEAKRESPCLANSSLPRSLQCTPSMSFRTLRSKVRNPPLSLRR